VEADARCAGFQIAPADDEHRVDAQLFRILNFCLDRIGLPKSVLTRTLWPRSSLAMSFRVFHERGGRGIVFRADGDDAHLIRCERAEKTARAGGSARRRDALKVLLSNACGIMQELPVPRWGGAGHSERRTWFMDSAITRLRIELLRRHILRLWAAAALPIFLLAWGAALADSVARFGSRPWSIGCPFWRARGCGWPFFVADIRREEGICVWATLHRRLWLKALLPRLEGHPVFRLRRILPSLLLMAASVLLGTLVSAAALMVSIMFPWSCLASPGHIFELASPDMVIGGGGDRMLAWVMARCSAKNCSFAVCCCRG